MVAELDKLRSIEDRYAFGDGACADIERDNRPAVRRALARLRASVDPDVRRALRQSFARPFKLARRRCDRHKPAPTPAVPTTPPAPPASLAPAPSSTPPTQTAPRASTDTATSGRTQSSKTSPRPPDRPQHDPPSEAGDNASGRRSTGAATRPATTDSPSGDPGSGGTPAPKPRRPVRR